MAIRSGWAKFVTNFGLSSRNFAADGFVALDDLLFPINPVRQNREGGNARFNDQSELGVVLKGDGDSEVAQIGREFDAINDFVFEFREVRNFSEGCVVR